MGDRVRVLVVFGGRSAEHEVSILSAKNVWSSLDRERFEPVLIGIDREGVWRIEPEATLREAAGDPRLLRLAATGPEFPVTPRPGGFLPSDVVFPVLHGTYGEDGTFQGLLELAGVAYVGAGVLGAAVGMDKDVAKRLLAQAQVPVVPWVTVRQADFERDPAATLHTAASLGFPCFVKPANAGSSVGVYKVKAQGALEAALRDAFRYDPRVLIEPALDIHEVECAVLGNHHPVASTPGEIVVHHRDGFYSYEAKYVDADGSHPEIPARLPSPVLEEVQVLATRAFLALGLSGLARVDFFVERGTHRVFLNEVNTLPGFTPISMYPKLWEHDGLSNSELVSRLITLAQERHAERARLALR